MPIPKKQLMAFDSLAKLDDATAERLQQAVAETAPALSVDDFSSAVSAKVTAIAPRECEAILEAVSGLFFLKERLGFSISEVTSRVVADGAEGKFSFTSHNREKFQKRLTQLLSLDASLGTTAKAYDVKTEYERIFCAVRILTDIRPVFTSAGDKAAAGLVIHNLLIRYHQGNEHNQFFVAMDSEDLQAIKDAISRAEQKERHLKSVLTKADIKC